MANEKSDEDVCLIIDEKNEESLRNTEVADTSLNCDSEAIKEDELIVEDSATEKVEENTQQVTTESTDNPTSLTKSEESADVPTNDANSSVPEVPTTSSETTNTDSNPIDSISKLTTSVEAHTLADVLANKSTLPPKKPRQRKPNAAKKTENVSYLSV